ncbi:hypothetical protein TRVL_09998 [Trypanosoma vivax]|nr:hypothetical protein TRVL_09998 [Trypanosoma vivax]
MAQHPLNASPAAEPYPTSAGVEGRDYCVMPKCRWRANGYAMFVRLGKRRAQKQTERQQMSRDQSAANGPAFGDGGKLQRGLPSFSKRLGGPSRSTGVSPDTRTHQPRT